MPITPFVQAIALSPTDLRIIVVGMEGNAVVRTEDGGQTWTRHLPAAVRDCHSMTFHATNSEDVWDPARYGDTWNQLPFNLKRFHRVMVMLGFSIIGFHNIERISRVGLYW